MTHYARQIPGVITNKVEGTIRFPGNGEAMFRSAEDAVSLRGEGPDHIGIDEAAFIQESIWTEALRPSLTDKRGSAWFHTSPNGFNWLHGLFDRGHDPDFHDWQSWQFPSWTNPLLDPEEIEQAKRETNPLTFRQEWGAEFIASAGRVFGDFSRELHVRECKIVDLRKAPTIVGVDFGYRTFAAVVCMADSHEGLWQYAECEWHNLTTQQAIDRMRREPWASRVELIACDPAGDATNLHSGIGDVQLLRSAFPKARVVFSTLPQHRSPEWRASRLRDRLFTAGGDVRYVVDPNCRATIRMWEQSVYPEHKPGRPEKPEPVKDGVNDHLRDAMGYLEVCYFHLHGAKFYAERPF